MNPLCECPVAGYCSRHKMTKNKAMHLLCRGVAQTRDCGYKYWMAWERGHLGATKPANPVPVPPSFCPDGPTGPDGVKVPCCGDGGQLVDVPKPSLVARAKTAAAAAVQFVADGCKTVSAESREKRLAACSTCEENSSGICRLCTCIISVKTRMRLEDCPIGRWEKEPDLEVESAKKTVPALGWAYGVTTIRQRLDDGLLKRTLSSLAKAGFDAPQLFVDDPADGFESLGLRVTARGQRVRPYGNWLLGLMELYLRQPKMDRYAMFQDDFVTSLGLREYLDVAPYPAKGYLNLYTFPHNQPSELAKRTSGGERTHPEINGDETGFYRACQNGKGAVALVFDNEAVRFLLSRKHMVDRVLNEVRGHRAIDGGVVDAMRQEGWVEYCHNPSLVQHTGLVSSMGNGQHALATSFRGEDFDLRTLL